jgi:ribosomal protein S18
LHNSPGPEAAAPRAPSKRAEQAAAAAPPPAAAAVPVPPAAVTAPPAAATAPLAAAATAPPPPPRSTGAGAADAPSSGSEEPPRLHPLRLFYPGQTYKPEDLDVDLTDSAAAFVHRPSQKTRQLHKRGQAANAELYASADFRNGRLLSGFISEAGKLLPRRTNKARLTRECATQGSHEAAPRRRTLLTRASDACLAPRRWMRRCSARWCAR